MSDTEKTEIEKTVNLDDREQYALTKWQAGTHPALAPDTQAKLFRLFLNGKSTHEIHRINPQFSLGQVVHARIKGKWDERYEQHMDELLNGVKARVQQVTLESIEFVSDLIAAANKKFGERIKKYLQTENPDDLGDLQITSLDGYRKAVELLHKLTGQDKAQGKSELTVVHKADESMQKPGIVQSSDEAAKILELLVAASKVKEKNGNT
jgi:hypothetical protein